MRESFKNSCHTLSRKDCYDVPQDIKSNINQYAMKTTNAVQFYNSPSCVLSMLGSASYLNLKISIFNLFVLIILTIFKF